jgi:hypothetical protein
LLQRRECAEQDRTVAAHQNGAPRPLQHMLCVAVSMNVARRPLTLL